jgi:hypothetical protein
MKSATKSAVTPQRGRFEEQATVEGFAFAASAKPAAAQIRGSTDQPGATRGPRISRPGSSPVSMPSA